MNWTRRKALGAAGAAAISSACAVRKPVTTSVPGANRLAPVDVHPDRVIRTVCGLRPYRPSGFVVRSEKFGAKTLVHHYGHGGAGITLSWGTGQLAADEAVKSGHSEAAVLGCGVIGLTTARLLQRRGMKVTIYAKDLPPQTTSNIAGGLWSPVTVFERERASPQFLDQFAQASRMSFRAYQDLTGDYYGVRWLPIHVLGSAPSRMFSERSPMYPIAGLFPERRELSKREHPFPVDHCLRFQSMLIEPPVYLNALTRDFLAQGGRIVVREFEKPAQVVALPEPLIMNCTGLGARALFGDEELTPIKGQLSFLVPQPEVAYCTLGPGDLYMFPRRDGILLGGTHEQGNWSLEPDQAQRERILKGNAETLRLWSKPPGLPDRHE